MYEALSYYELKQATALSKLLMRELKQATALTKPKLMMRLTSTTNRFTFVFMLDKVKQCEKSLTNNAKRVCVRVRAWQRDYREK